MKRNVALFLALTSLLLMTGCGTGNNSSHATETDVTETNESMVTENPWGVTLAVTNVTPTGATLVCTQSGGNPTGDLQTGSPYQIQVYTEDGWMEAPRDSVELAWTMEAWMIPKNDSVEWSVNWEYLYGTLPSGTYRISKQIMDFRATGNYDTQVYYAEFAITD